MIYVEDKIKDLEKVIKNLEKEVKGLRVEINKINEELFPKIPETDIRGCLIKK